MWSALTCDVEAGPTKGQGGKIVGVCLATGMTTDDFGAK